MTPFDKQSYSNVTDNYLFIYLIHAMNTQNKMVLLEAIVSAACFVIEDGFFSAIFLLCCCIVSQ